MPKMDCIPYGRLLIETGDLDPVYMLVWNCEELRENRYVMEHWLLAYWSFYHMGTASWITDGWNDDFSYWERFQAAAVSKQYPRCRERRHYRGHAARASYNYLSKRGIEDLFSPFREPKEFTCKEVMTEVKTWVAFGDWIAFKAADMLERLGLASIAFSVDDVYLFDSPKEGARRLAESLSASPTEAGLNAWAVDTLVNSYKDLKAPPRYERPIGAQEAETVLCKHKSYLNGKYKLKEDIESCQNCLRLFQERSLLANNLYQVGKKIFPEWSQQHGACSTKTPLLKTT